MLRWIIRRRLDAFERTFDYDLGYAREILETDARAFLAFAPVAGLSRYRRDVPLDVLYAAKLAGTMAEDCGPCTPTSSATWAELHGAPTVASGSAMLRQSGKMRSCGSR
jgi:hypothetical protein